VRALPLPQDAQIPVPHSQSKPAAHPINDEKRLLSLESIAEYAFCSPHFVQTNIVGCAIRLNAEEGTPRARRCTMEVYAVLKEFAEWGKRVYPRLPTPLRNGLKAAGVCHFVVAAYGCHSLPGGVRLVTWTIPAVGCHQLNRVLTACLGVSSARCGKSEGQTGLIAPSLDTSCTVRTATKVTW
jgi:hypothetical protein